MKTNEFTTLPNGLPLYKLMQYKLTGEQCRVIKINKALFDNTIDSEIFGQLLKPFSLDIRITRIIQGIETSTIETVGEDDLIVWNESISPKRTVTYRTRKKKTRTVIYN